MNMIKELLPQIGSGLTVTLSVFILTLVISIPLGIIVAIGRIKGTNITKRLIDLYILVMRGTPLLLQIIFIFFGLPLLGIKFSRFTAAIIAFVLNYGAYFAEIFRGGIESIDEGQREASKVLGISDAQMYRRIILPQSIKIVLPSIGNEVISLVKDTALVYVVGLEDILRVGKIATNTDASLVPLLLVGVIYLILVLIISLVFKKLEKRYSYYK
ncbi:amino acid ABC transporter permease [Clostridium sp. LY3-2]|uniref:amino acid ABC transporter permease n=1 Tax=Clostridium sp. LY3-2 TaxID=2942482 RepID=UPI00215208F6|nr:amino acid ABC transporter permease [Clostridium sp. LY3-2]MCR6515200.1 amino acid ABC transporter permease [Clostridium sp. LY3-2]